MKKKTTTKGMTEVRASVRRMQLEGERLVKRIRRDAESMRSGFVKDMGLVRKEVTDRAGRAIRDLEHRVVKGFHAATTERVAALAKRLGAFEERLAAVERKLMEFAGRKVA
jgi:hypothetical protein